MEHVFDLLPGYALGCLDEDDLLKVARHLPDCPACRSDLATYWAAADQLAFAAPARVPPPELKRKVLRRVERAASIVAQPAPVTTALPGKQLPASEQAAPGRQAAPERQAAPARRTGGVFSIFRSLLARPVGLAFGAVALLLVAFLGISNLLLWQRVNDLQGRVPQGNMQLVRLEGTDNAPQAHGYLMVFKNETYGTLVIDNAPKLEPGHEYQLWLIRDGKRTSGGVFSVSEDGYGTLQVISGQPLESYPSFGITIEPAGGSPAPTGKKILGGSF